MTDKQIPDPLWPLPDDFEKPQLKTVGNYWVLAVYQEKPYVLNTWQDALDKCALWMRDQSKETEYTQRREKLARFLCDLVYGEGAWVEVDEDTLLNYRLDADDIIKANPHLLSLEERERLEGTIPELALEGERDG